MDYKQELKKWISDDYERRVKQWMASDPAQLLDDAEAIAATQLIRDNIDEAINDQDAKFLLGLDDPLGYLTGRWISENGAEVSHKEELLHCVWTLQQELGDVPLSLKQQSGGMAQSHSSASSWLLVCLLRYSARSCLLAGRVACFPQSGHCSGSSGASNR